MLTAAAVPKLDFAQANKFAVERVRAVELM